MAPGQKEKGIRRLTTLAVALLLNSCSEPPSSVPVPVRTATVDVGADQLAYIEAGQGEPLILIHGGFQDYRMWQPFFPAFSQGHWVIAYSRRNHWPNDRDPSGTPDSAADEHARDLFALVNALELRRVHIVAHSAGAATALFFSAEHPQLVRSLVIVEPPVASLLTAEAGDRKASRDFMADMGEALSALRRQDDKAAVRLFADAVGGRGTFERRTAKQKAMMLDNIAAHSADAAASRQRPQFTCAMAQRITAPVLLVRGTRSPAFFHRIAARLADCLPNERVEMINASHTVPGENQGAFQLQVESFLIRHRGN
jgi:pimeloyl-ACP methyl ester carboxylesterase